MQNTKPVTVKGTELQVGDILARQTITWSRGANTYIRAKDKVTVVKVEKVADDIYNNVTFSYPVNPGHYDKEWDYKMSMWPANNIKVFRTIK